MQSQQSRPTKVLVVGARGIPDVEGGAEKNAEALFPRMVELGYDITLLGLQRFIHADNYKGVKLRAAPEFRTLKTDKLAYYVSALFTCISTRPDVVHLQGLGSAIFLWAYKLSGHKVVVRYGSADYILPKWGRIGRAGFRFSEWQLRFADAVISVAPSLSRRLADEGISANVHMIPNALDDVNPGAPPSVSHPRPYILMVGRVTEQKNVAKLLEAFALVAEKNPNIDLLVAGGCDDEDYFTQLQPMITERTVFLGRVPRSDVPGLLDGASLFVNVSVHEGSSNATLEAISHNRAIVLSDIPENRDMSLPDHIYVDPGDAQAIAERLDAALNDHDRFVIDKSRFLDWDAVTSRTIAIYRDICGAKAVRLSEAV